MLTTNGRGTPGGHDRHHGNGNGRPAAIAPHHTAEPLAIVGIGCRLPGGADDWQSFWELLETGRDAVGETPEERWSSARFYQSAKAAPGKTVSRWGGHVTGLERFDPQAFGISPREAAMMDPQQRMLLEVAWRAIEDAGRDHRQLAGSDVGVFIGISGFDHALATLSLQDRGVLDAYSNTGGSSSIAANRISYCFDLRGPSLAVDTACSSSLVAVHLACEAIRRGESRMALAGGVNALLMPDFTVAFSQLGVLSPDGRCKTFDARANGYVRSEGAGMVLIRPLRDAIADGDLVYAVIRSTALNQDGRTPGLTVPSGEAQQALVREACRRGGVDPRSIHYVEAHGTGTPVGDPIEANALGAALGVGRPADAPCLIGSVKTNIGHLESAAGIASLIKVALAIHHGRIPAHLHLQQPNPAIDFRRLGLRVPTRTVPWPTGQGPRRAGINGFGYGGANAHVILEEAPVPSLDSTREPASEWVSEPLLVPLAARSGKPLAAAAEALADWLTTDTTPLVDAVGFLAHRRSGGNARAAVVARDRKDLVAQLRELAAADPAVSRTSPLATNEIAFVFSGQGPQWWAMGRRLFAASGTFRRVVERCGTEFARYGDWSLVEELLRDEGESRMQQTRIAQPAIFAIQAGIAAVWQQWGIEPAFCVGHSVGEIAAAHVAGGLSFEDACRVAFHRGRTMDLASSHGAMIAVGLSRDELAPWLAGCEAEVSVAAVNGPTSLTLSGSAVAIDRLATAFERSGIFCRRLAVEYAFHSPLMDPVRDALLASLADIKPCTTAVPLISTVTGGLLAGDELDGDYWWRNVRQPVLFADAMASLAAAGPRTAIEIGPHPVLAFAINECFQAAARPVTTLPSLHRERDDVATMLGSLGRLHALGLEVDWNRLYPRPARRLAVPPEPFLTQSLRSESREARLSRQARGDHPLLGERGDGPAPMWQCRIDLRLQSFLRDHRVRSACVHPAAAYIDAAIAAAAQLTGSDAGLDPGGVRLRRLQLLKACIHDETAPRWMECHHRADRRSLSFVQRGVDDSDWTEVACVGIATSSPIAPAATDEAAIRDRCTEAFDRDRLYAYCSRLGLHYGEAFQGMVTGVRRDGECLAEVMLPAAVAADADRHAVHPALLDACFHGMIAADRDFDHTISGLYLPHEVEEIRYLASPGARATVHVRIVDRSDDRIVADIDIRDAAGGACLAIRGFQSHRVSGTAAAETTSDLVYRLEWEEDTATTEARTAEESTSGRWLVFTDTQGYGHRVAEALTAAGDDVILVRHGELFMPHADGSFTLDPNDPTGFVRLLEATAAGGITGVLYLWALDTPTADATDADSLAASSWLTCRGPLHLIQAWEQAGPTGQAACFFVTAGAQEPPAGMAAPLAVAQAPLIGMARVIASEYARLRTRLVDVPTDPAEAVPSLVAELRRTDREDEVQLRGDRRWVRRFRPHASLAACPAATAALPARLEAAASAGVEDLDHRLFHPVPLAADEIEIEVYAAGLNFSDVMKALALYPGLPPGPPALGSECSGVVSRVGQGVTAWRPGDEVIAVAPGAFATHVVVGSDLVARKPRNLSHEQAAAIPIAFLTAAYAIQECGRVRAGERVLIHAASGGVGLAAMQLARLAGARIFATAGNDEKRAFVRARGAEHVMDSRSLTFADEAVAVAGGIDIILNSLPGEAIPRGIDALAVGGRFLEIGKRDIYADAALGLHAFRNNIAFFAIDLDQLFKRQPARMGELLRTLPDRFESGELEPLPVAVHPAADAVAAFRSMQQARHIGKLVIDYRRRPARVRPPAAGSVRLDRDGSYWVAGGLGGFGLEVARWLASRGAGTIVLGGRSDRLTAAAATAIAEIEAAGSRVQVLPADITDPADVRRVLATIAEELPPLRGIFHTAMVLEDRLLVDLDLATLDRVLQPKVLGGWNLHRESLGLDLDLFVVFSSLSSVFGHAGQANYAAANAALDALAHHRRGLGLPATVINWGHLGEVGYLARRSELSARLERQGVLSFTVRQAMDCLGYALTSREPQVSVLRMDWTRWRGLGITDNVPPKFAHLLRAESTTGEAGDQRPLSPEVVLAAAPADRQRLVERGLRGKLAGLLGCEPDSLEMHRPLLDLGLDSLMAVELRNWTESQLGVALPISALMRATGAAAVVDAICEPLTAAAGQIPASAPTDAATANEPAGPAEFPLSAGQRGLWFAFRRDPAGSAYNVSLPTRVRSPLDIAALRQTIELVVERHAALRTTFADTDGRLTQRIHPSLPPEFTEIDASDLDLDQVRRLAADDAARPFDLEHGPLLRVTAYRRAVDDWIVQATAHHIAVDFWSLILLLDEIGHAYPRLAAGEPAGLPPAAANYEGFVRRQHELLSGPRAAALREHWRRELAEIPPILELPTDRPRPLVFSGAAATAPLQISAATSTAMIELAAREQVTPAAVMLAAVQVLLARLSGRSSFLIGMPFSGRSEQRFEDTVGFFVTMLPIAARLDDNPRFSDVVRRAGETLLRTLEQEDYPLESIVADSNCLRDPSRSPLFQVTCTFERSHRRHEQGRGGFLFPDRTESVEFGGLRQESFPVPQRHCLHDLEFVFEQGEDGFRGMLLYAEELFAPDSIACLARNLEGLVTALVAAADAPVSDVAWPMATPLPIPEAAADETATALLRESVAAAADRPAIVAGPDRWSYAALAGVAESVAAAATAAGLPTGSLLPVAGEGGRAILGTVATLLAGFAPVPIDTRQPAVAAADLLADTAAPLVLTAGGSRWLAAGPAVRSLEIANLPLAIGSRSTAIDPTGHDLAYCIFTSGSTGRPKGVLVEQASVANLLRWRRDAVPLTADDRVLLTLSHQFDAALGTTLATLAQGATLVLAGDECRRDVEALIDQVIRDEITVLVAVPTLIELMARHRRFTECKSLRQIWTGGEQMPADLPELVGRLPAVRLWNFYGPTEATVEATACEVTRRPATMRVPIGSPIAGSVVAVVDEAGRPVPDTVPGELIIAGPGLARGYLNRPELTAERFVMLASPKGPVRAYRTGDRGRRRADGHFEYLGRLDDQIKLRGYRIELGEIESCLRAHPAVAEAAVTVLAPDTPRASLAAFVVPHLPAVMATPESRAATAALIREHATTILPGFKLPASINFISELPRTSSGKIDRRALPASLAAHEPLDGIAEPRTPLERRLAELWQEASGVDRVGIRQNFFDLGGTSLQAALLTARLSDDLGMRVPTSLLFDLADIAQVARRLAELHPDLIAKRFGAESLFGPAPDPAAPPHPLLVPLAIGGSSEPVFLIHPPGGVVACYAAVAQPLGGDRPVYGIRSRGLHGSEQLPESVAEMAAEYAAAIRAVCPHGPCIVGGWSLGGLVAAEVARELIATGQDVDRLLLFDTAIPGSEAGEPGRHAGLEYGLDLDLEALGAMTPDEQLPFLFEHARRLGLIDEQAPPDLVDRVLADLRGLFAHHARLCAAHRPQPLSVDAVLFRPEEVPFDIGGPADRGWGELVRSLELRYVPGHHHSMVAPPHAAVLAARIGEILAGVPVA